MRAFHMTWFAFFLCFFAWFGIAPLMKIVREEMSLTKNQIGWCIIGSVAITVIARLFIGWLCDRIGPRLSYTWLLLLGSIPVMGIGFAKDFETFLLFRIAIGAIGASFVITQYHTSIMFAPNCVGTANATTAGWGNLGGGVTQIVMPVLFALFVGVLGFSDAIGWRAAMFIAGLVCALTGVAYYFFTQDAPDGNFEELRAKGKMPEKRMTKGAFLEASKDKRVWALFVIYGACFGIELTINNIAALYFLDYFEYFKAMDEVKAVGMAGLIASLFGLMNIFARTLGGVFGDKFGQVWGLSGRVKWLFMVLFCEGLCLMLFSQMSVARACHSHIDPVQPVRADVRRGHVLRRAFHQQKGFGFGGWDCWSRRKRRSGRGGVFVQSRGNQLADGALYFGNAGHVQFVPVLRGEIR